MKIVKALFYEKLNKIEFMLKARIGICQLGMKTCFPFELSWFSDPIRRFIFALIINQFNHFDQFLRIQEFLSSVILLFIVSSIEICTWKQGANVEEEHHVFTIWSEDTVKVISIF